MVYSVAIAGASGYVGGELMRLIAQHPELELKTLTANSNVGQSVTALHPHLIEYAEHQFVPTSAETLAGHDIVFLALPHAMSGEVASWLDADTLVLDCGADHRLESREDWEKFYGGTHSGTWTYGMPELQLIDGDKQRKNLVAVKRIAVPGCNVTAITLALAPLIAAGLIESEDIVSVLSVGTTGAGRVLKTNLLASEVLGAAAAYAVGGAHRHTPEIEQNFRRATQKPVSISFTPVLIPMSRGILAVNTARLKPGVNLASVTAALSSCYAGEAFVRLTPAGTFPSTASVLGSNVALIGVSVDEHAKRVVVISAIDNLVKGTAGAALQSMNIALGLAETTGLPVNGVAP